MSRNASLKSFKTLEVPSVGAVAAPILHNHSVEPFPPKTSTGNFDDQTSNVILSEGTRIKVEMLQRLKHKSEERNVRVELAR